VGLCLRLPVRQTLREHGGRRQEGRHLLFDQLLLLHRGGKHDLRELVSPRCRCAVASRSSRSAFFAASVSSSTMSSMTPAQVSRLLAA
jgi:hypothetical protein